MFQKRIWKIRTLWAFLILTVQYSLCFLLHLAGGHLSKAKTSECLNSPGEWAVSGVSPTPLHSYTSVSLLTLCSARNSLPAISADSPFLPGLAPTPLPRKASQMPSGCALPFCIFLPCAMMVGVWDCVWGETGLTGISGGHGHMDRWTEGRPLEASVIDTTWDSS